MTMKREVLKSDNRRELYPTYNNGDNCIMEYRHIGCNSVKNLKLQWDTARGLYFTIAGSLCLKIRQNFCDQLCYNFTESQNCNLEGPP